MFPRNLEFPESFYVSGLIQKRKPNERQLKMIYIYVPFPTKILNSVASTSTFASISFCNETDNYNHQVPLMGMNRYLHLWSQTYPVKLTGTNLNGNVPRELLI